MSSSALAPSADSASPERTQPAGTNSSAGPPSAADRPMAGVGPTPSRRRLTLASLRAAWRGVSLRKLVRTKLPIPIVLLAAASVYTAVLGWILSQRYQAFQTFAWDLGVYNQAIYTTVYSHRLFYYTADLPAGGIGTLLGTHFSPFMFLILPFYALSPGPPGLLVIEAAGLAAGTIPLYLLARGAGLPKLWSLFLASAYLSSPILMGTAWYDFHAEAFLPFTVLLAVYCYYYAGRWTFLGSWVLCLSVIETVSALLFLFAIASVLGLLFDRFRHIARPRLVWEKTTLAIVAVPLWIGLAEAFATFVNRAPISTFGTGYASAYSVLGPNLSFLAVVPYALLHPSAALAALGSEGSNKLAYVLVLFGSMAFLPVLGPKRLLLAAAGWLVLAVLSNGGTLVQFGTQYSAYGFSFLVAGMPFGLARLRTLWTRRTTAPSSGDAIGRPQRRWHRPGAVVGPSAAAVAVALAVGISTSMVSPLLTDPAYNYPEIAHGIPVENTHDVLLHQIIALMPPAAGVTTVSPVFPEVSSRVDAYVVPTSSSFRPGLTFVEAVDGYVNDSRYVLLDYLLDFFDSSILVAFANLTGFGVLAEADQILLLERGWQGPPEFWVPAREVWCPSTVYPSNYSYRDLANTTGCGPAISSLPGVPYFALLWYGPYVYGMLPGQYSVTFWLSVATPHGGRLLRLDSVSYGLGIQMTPSGPTSAEHEYWFRFYNNGTQTTPGSTYLSVNGSGPQVIDTNVTVDFDWGNLSTWGVAGWVYTPDIDVHLFEVTLQQIAP